MKSWFIIRIARCRPVLAAVAVAAAVVCAVPLALASPLPPGSDDPGQVSQTWYMVLDRADLLDEGQERSAINDAYRLNLYGIPTQVVTEALGLDQAQADARARELRITHGIESSPNADDGILLYASVDRFDQSQTVMSISIGLRTLPRNGLNGSAMADIRQSVMVHQIAEGHPARAIVYSLREMIYLEQYVPPPAPVVSGWRATMQPVVDILAPVLAVTVIAVSIRASAPGDRASSNLPVSSIALILVSTGLVLLAIATRSSIGVVCAHLAGAFTIWQAIRLDRHLEPARMRTVAATPRPPRPSTTSPGRVSRR